jgi:hypothetical protein
VVSQLALPLQVALRRCRSRVTVATRRLGWYRRGCVARASRKCSASRIRSSRIGLVRRSGANGCISGPFGGIAAGGSMSRTTNSAYFRLFERGARNDGAREVHWSGHQRNEVGSVASCTCHSFPVGLPLSPDRPSTLVTRVARSASHDPRPMRTAMSIPCRAVPPFRFTQRSAVAADAKIGDSVLPTLVRHRPRPAHHGWSPCG